jgi:FkbM family methyltransferase
MNTTEPHQTEIIELEIAGKPIRFAFTSALGLRPFVEAVLTGADYPLVFPGIYRPTSIVDIGAHAGAATVYFKSHYPEARITCFEPCKDSFRNLSANTRQFDDVKLHNRALGEANGEAQLFSGQYSSMQHSLKPNAENTSDFEWVSVLSAIEAFDALGETPPSMIKIDTEGCELEILTAILPLLAKVDVIYLEYHSEADRLALDRLLADEFLLYAARADVPHRGTNTYIRNDVFARCSEIVEKQYVFPKE